MNRKHLCLYIFIILTSCTNTSATTLPTSTNHTISALIYSAWNSSRAIVQRNSLASALFILGGSYALAETISYKYRKKTFFAGTFNRYLHDITYGIMKKMLCMQGSLNPIVLKAPDLYKN